MQMRSIIFVIFASMICGKCNAGDVVSVRVVEGAVPTAVDRHREALRRLANDELFARDVPRSEENAINCGHGTVVIWGKEKKGRPFVTDTSVKSEVLVYAPTLPHISESSSVALTGEDSFLYISVAQAGRVCAGYATSGRVDFKLLSAGVVEVRVDAEVKKIDLSGTKSCTSGRLTLAFTVDQSNGTYEQDSRSQCSNEMNRN